MSTFQQVLSLDPSHIETHYRLGRLLNENHPEKNIEKAIHHVKEAVKLGKVGREAEALLLDLFKEFYSMDNDKIQQACVEAVKEMYGPSRHTPNFDPEALPVTALAWLPEHYKKTPQQVAKYILLLQDKMKLVPFRSAGSTLKMPSLGEQYESACQRLEKSNRGDSNALEPIEILKMLAEKKVNPWAILAASHLGKIYSTNEHVDPSFEKALHYLEQANTGGNPVVLRRLGLLFYEFSDPEKRSIEKATDYFRQGYQLKDVKSGYYLSRIYVQSKAPKEQKKGYQLLTALANKKKYFPSMISLASAYSRGLQTLPPVNSPHGRAIGLLEEALELTQKEADPGFEQKARLVLNVARAREIQEIAQKIVNRPNPLEHEKPIKIACKNIAANMQSFISDGEEHFQSPLSPDYTKSIALSSKFLHLSIEKLKKEKASKKLLSDLRGLTEKVEKFQCPPVVQQLTQALPEHSQLAQAISSVSLEGAVCTDPVPRTSSSARLLLQTYYPIADYQNSPD